MAELKVCPFCGGEAVRRTCIVPHCDKPWHYIVCGNSNCLVEPGTAAYANSSGAAKAWNRRAGDGK